jgi:glycosyl transferase family 4
VSRKVLILSPYFPPSSLAGVHRARHLAKHLPSFGWTPMVLCVDEAYHEERLDPDLAKLVPPRLELLKVQAAPAWLTRCIGFGDVSLRAWTQLRRTLFAEIAKGRIDVVLITGSPFYPMLLAPGIARRFRIPIVLDFQDPWVSTWGATQPALSKNGLSHRLAKLFEPLALRNADFITSVSDTQNAEMAMRYPWLEASRMAAIPIGGDPDDFAVTRPSTIALGDSDLEPGFVHLSYVGTFMPRSGPLMQALFRAFARLRLSEPELAARIRLNFVGTSNQPNGDKTYRVRPLAEAEGVTDAVREIPQRLPYLQALEVITKSNGLLLIGSDEPHYTASKIYPALMSGRPYLSLFHTASSANVILTLAGGGCSLAFKTKNELDALEPSIVEGLRTLALYPCSLGRVDPSVFAPYEARNIAKRFAGIFDGISSRQSTSDIKQ